MSTLGPTTTHRVGGRDWEVPQGYAPAGMARCSGPYCHDPVLWVLTPLGRRMPLNEDGNAHHSTCPDVDRFRRKGGQNL